MNIIRVHKIFIKKIILTLSIMLLPLSLMATSMAGVKDYLLLGSIFFSCIALIIASLVGLILYLVNKDKWAGKYFKIWISIFLSVFCIPMIILSIILIL